MLHRKHIATSFTVNEVVKITGTRPIYYVGRILESMLTDTILIHKHLFTFQYLLLVRGSHNKKKTLHVRNSSPT